jgi:hypothetical protein
MWLKPHLEEACRVLVARVSADSKCREKCKKPETMPPYVPLYPLLHRKGSGLIDLMHSIIQTHKPPPKQTANSFF